MRDVAHSCQIMMSCVYKVEHIDILTFLVAFQASGGWNLQEEQALVPRTGTGSEGATWVREDGSGGHQYHF